MTVTTKRGDEPQEVKMVTIQIGNSTYRCTESVDGKLNINKTTKDDMELMLVNPRSGNEIEIM